MVEVDKEGLVVCTERIEEYLAGELVVETGGRREVDGIAFVVVDDVAVLLLVEVGEEVIAE